MVKALFTAVQAYGHLLPTLPLARVAREAGDEVLVAAGANLRPAVGDLAFAAFGLSAEGLMAEAVRRYGSPGVETDDTSAGVGVFTELRATADYDELLRLARDFGPDLVVSDDYDVLAALVASALGVPHVAHVISPPARAFVREALDAGTAAQFERLGLVRTTPWAVSLWPGSMIDPGGPAGRDVTPLRPTAYTDPTAGTFDPGLGQGGRPTVLLTLGTIVADQDLVARALRQLAGLDVDVIATSADGVDAEALGLSADRFAGVGFVPLDQLLGHASLVVTAGGAGTVLGALGAGLPLVVMPVLADQPSVAAIVARAGVGVVCENVDDLATAVRGALDDTSLGRAAGRVAAEIAATDGPAEVWSALAGRVRSTVR